VINDVASWREWELRKMAAEPIDVARNLRLADAKFALALAYVRERLGELGHAIDQDLTIRLGALLSQLNR
jgi:hypothetical protein